MSHVVLVGPFWTRSEAASYLGITGAELRERKDVVRLEGRWLEETYPALQFRDNTVRHEIATIVEAVGDELPGAAIADWLSRVNPLLSTMTPIDWFNSGLSIKTALTAIQADVETARQRVQSSATVGAVA